MALADRKINYTTLILLACLVVIIVFSINFLLDWRLKGDGFAYFQTMQVIKGESVPDFIPNRLLTTFLTLNSVLLLDKLVGNLLISWLSINILLYLLLNFSFYFLLQRLFRSNKTALLGTLFVATNYGILLGGMWNFIVDMGGWAFYALSALLLYKYANSKDNRFLYLASIVVGLGGLFKEYAFGGGLLIAIYLLYESGFSPIKFIRKAILPGLTIIVPAAIFHWHIYNVYHYSYLNWIEAQAGYVYVSRLIEYIKSFGSLVNFLAFAFIGGLYYLWQDRKENRLTSLPDKAFIACVALSTMPVFLWKAITQRTLALAIFPIIMVSAFLFKRWERYWYLFVVLLLLYVVTNFLMDSFVLDFVNLPF